MAFLPDEPEVTGGFTPDEDIVTEVPSTYTGKKKASVLESILPGTMQNWKAAESPGAYGAAAVATPMTLLGDILGIPARGLATARGESMGDPSAAILRPEMEGLKKGLFPAKEGVRPTGKTVKLPDGREIPLVEGLMPDIREQGKSLGRGAIEIGGQMASDPLTILTSLVAAAKGIPKVLPKVLAATTGLEEDVIKQAAKTPKTSLVKYAGKEESIGKAANEMAQNFHQNVPFEAAVTKVLEKAPPIDISPTIQKVANYRSEVSATMAGHPAGEQMLKSIDNLFNYLVQQRDMYGGEVPALEAHKVRKWLDNQISSWGAAPSMTPIDDRAYKMARSSLASEISDQAGSEFAGLMSTYSDAVQSAKNIQKATGTPATGKITQGRKQQLFGQRAGVSGPEKEALFEAESLLRSPELRARLGSIATGAPAEDLFDISAASKPMLVDEARLAALARKLGMAEGSEGIPVMSKTQGIRSLILPILAAGGALPSGGMSLPAAALASPKVAVGLQQLADMIPPATRWTGPVMPYSVLSDISRAGMEKE